MESYKWGGKGGKSGEKGTGNKKHKWQVQNRQREGKNIIGNGEAKDLVCTNHGHELKWGNDGGRGIQGRGE